MASYVVTQFNNIFQNLEDLEDIKSIRNGENTNVFA